MKPCPSRISHSVSSSSSRFLAPGASQSLAQPAASPAAVTSLASSNSLLIVENAGQWPAAARFQVWNSPLGAGTAWLAEDAVWIVVSRQVDKEEVDKEEVDKEEVDKEEVDKEEVDKDGRSRCDDPLVYLPTCLPVYSSHALKLTFPGSNPDVRIEPYQPLPTTVSYFIGNDPTQWRSAAPVWGGVRYVDLYPGVDLVLDGREGGWRLEALDGAVVDEVSVQVEGAGILDTHGTRVRLAMKEESLELVLPRASFVYHVEGTSSQGNRLALDVRPSADAPPQPTTPEDNPGALIYSTYLGGTGDEYYSDALAVDGADRVVVAGGTKSSNFPTTPGAFDPSFNSGHWNAFVVRLSADGSTLDYATFLGGSRSSAGLALALDAAGRAAVTGFTDSSDFPTTAGAFDPDYGGGDLDAFVLVLGADGSAIDYATFLGGSGYDVGEDLALDAAGSVTVTGDTRSSDFPTTPGAFDTSYDGGNCDTFVVKLNPAGSDLVYATFLGGSYDEYGFAVALDSAGRATVAGFTWSSDFPTTPGAFDTVHGGWYTTDAFVVRLDANGAALDYATLLGGSGFEVAYGLALDANGCATVTGDTSSSDFPTTPGAFDTSFSGSSSDVFVLHCSIDGSTLNYATFLGGYGSAAEGRDLALDADGSAVVTGYAYYDFPTTPDALDRSYNGANCQTHTRVDVPTAFWRQLNGAGSMLVYSTYLGGTHDNSGTAVALDAESRAVVMGSTYSGDFPTTPGALTEATTVETAAAMNRRRVRG